MAVGAGFSRGDMRAVLPLTMAIAPQDMPEGLAVALAAGGTMIFVVSHEAIFETHRNGHQTPATVGLPAGFALMMVLDTMPGQPAWVRE